MYKKAVALLITLCMVLAISPSALAYESPEKTGYKETPCADAEFQETIIESICAFKKDFPEANISIEQSLEYAAQRANAPLEERLADVTRALESGPEYVYTKTLEDGSVITLEVYSPWLIQETGTTPGTEVTNGTTTYYTGTKVWVHHLVDFWSCIIYYYVDYYYDEYYDVAGITNAYSPFAHGSIQVTLGNPYFVSTSGTYSEIRVELYQNEYLGGLQPASYLGIAFVRFFAYTNSIQTGWTA